ncbi:MAG TPA: DNA-binding protein WhiA [Firmicutes bacterium]|nr:DNA-binding protein WhiA [Bacillota bacterium]
MSFGSDLKKELCALTIQENELQAALAYGLFLFSRTFSPISISIQTESPYVLELYCNLMRSLIGISPSVNSSIPKRGIKRTYSAVVEQEEACKQVFRFFHHRIDEVKLQIHGENVDSLAKIACFIRGAYLACGSISDPVRGYHLEFSTPHQKLGKDLARLIEELGASPKITQRKGSYILYLKESENIEDLLTAMGAVHSSLELMNIKIYKELRNKANRITNCETANIEKTVVAASAQAQDIQYIIQKRGLDFLPEELQEIAKLRLNHPDLSLRELGELLNEPISRSGVNHRLKRLSEIARKLQNSEK